MATKRGFALAVVLLGAALASSYAGVAYHIQGNAAPGGVFTSGDWAEWVVPGGPVMLCESDGLLDVRNPKPSALPGTGGLCTTGSGPPTGVEAPKTSAEAAGVPDRWVRLDVCDALSLSRPWLDGGRWPCDTGLSESGDAPGNPLDAGRTDVHAFQVEIGVFGCYVPVGGIPPPPEEAANNFVLYYRELYAWWSYDGDEPDDDPAFHGHVFVAPDLAESLPGASVRGSIETRIEDPPLGLTDEPEPGAPSNNCGLSPSNPPSGMPGPVVRAQASNFGYNGCNPAPPAPPTPGQPALATPGTVTGADKTALGAAIDASKVAEANGGFKYDKAAGHDCIYFAGELEKYLEANGYAGATFTCMWKKNPNRAWYNALWTDKWETGHCLTDVHINGEYIWIEAQRSSAQGAINPGANPRAIAPRDLDGDGKIGVAFQNGSALTEGDTRIEVYPDRASSPWP